VALTSAVPDARERENVEPFAEQLLSVARQVDPDATYTLSPPIDPGIWVMHLYVSLDLADESNLQDVLAERSTDIMIEHNVGLATLLYERKAAVEAPPGNKASGKS
jgi:hypothetical protein